MLLSAVYLLLITLMVGLGLVLIAKADIGFQEKRSSALLVVSMFMLILSLNELQNHSLTQKETKVINELSDYFSPSEILPYDEAAMQEDTITHIDTTFGFNVIQSSYPTFHLLKSSDQKMNETRDFLKDVCRYSQSLGQEAVFLQVSQRSPMVWDVRWAEETFSQVATYTKAILIPSLLVIEYDADELDTFVTFIMNAYNMGNMRVVIFGRGPIIEPLKYYNEDYYWLTRLVNYE